MEYIELLCLVDSRRLVCTEYGTLELEGVLVLDCISM